MPVEQTQSKVVLKHPQGPSAEILLYGATVISWKSGSNSVPEPKERLFVSSKAALDGSKPVRGGIPVVFPCFGPPSHPDHSRLGQHGFARSEVWNFDSIVMDNEAGVSVRLTLDPSAAIQAVYPYNFQLAFVVTLAAHQLSTDLHVTNPVGAASTPFVFQALFHNYIRAPSSFVQITPLKGVSYVDKTVEGAPVKVEQRSAVDVTNYTDFVYESAGGKYEINWPNGVVQVRATNLKDVVVWNPQKDAGSKISDMEDGGWDHYVCVEPGHVRGFVTVAPGERWIGQQVLSVVHEQKL